jgi:CRP-like cAMP-binding protein
MPDTPDLLDVLAQSSMFGGLPRRQLKLIARYSRPLTASAGQRLVNQGDPGADFCIIVEGACAVDRNGVALPDLGPGDAFGEVAVIDGQPRTATVTATVETQLVVLSQPDFEHAMKVAPDLGRAMLLKLCSQLRAADAVAVD